MAIKKDQSSKKEYWKNELNSLGIEQNNELESTEELKALADGVKQAYYQNYKAAYSSKDEESGSDFIA